MNYHDSTFHDLDNVIHSLARHWSKRIGLSWDNHGQDLVQTGWLTTARVSPLYQPRGFKFITYAYLSISRDIRKAATRIAVNERTVTCLDTALDFDDQRTDIGRLLHPSNEWHTPDDPRQRDHAWNAAVRELLTTPDGLELLAAELGLRDKSKRGTKIRKEQLDALRLRFNQLSEAA